MPDPEYKIWTETLAKVEDMRTFSQRTGRAVVTAHQKETTNMAWTSEQDRHVSRALGRAIRHVRRVTNRQHISSDRDERLNQFVVSVRRELAQIRGAGHVENNAYSCLCDALANKKYWYDVGQLSAANPITLASGGGYSVSAGIVNVSNEDLKRWIRLSRHLETETEAQAYDIATDIELIAQGIGSLEDSVDEVQRINQEGDELAGQLARLFA